MNYGICAGVGGNTGQLDCDVERGNPTGLTFGSKVFGKTDYATELAFILAFTTGINQSNGVPDKLFPIGPILGTDDQTDAAKYGTSGYGVKFLLIDERPSFQFQLDAGASVVKNLKKFNGKKLPVYVHDDNSLTWGVRDRNGIISGATCTIGVAAGSFGDAKDKKFVLVTISYLNSTDFSQDAVAVQAGFSSTDLLGLYDVVFSEQAAHTTNVFHIYAKIPSVVAGQDVNVVTGADGVSFSTASNFLAFTGANFATSLPITSTTITGDHIDFTFDTTLYTALASGAQIKLQSIGTQGLITAGVTRLDPGFIILTK